MYFFCIDLLAEKTEVCRRVLCTSSRDSNTEPGVVAARTLRSPLPDAIACLGSKVLLANLC